MYNPRPLSPAVALQLKQLKLHLDTLRKEIITIDKNLAQLSASVDAASGVAPGITTFRSVPGIPLTPAMIPLDQRLRQLMEAVQMESRRFQTISNTMKMRHDVTMNAINNMK